MKTRREFVLETAALGAASALGTRLFAQDAVKPAAAKPLSILFLGGTGFLGPHQVEYALKRGHKLTLFNRGKTHPGLFPDVDRIVGDRDGKLDGLKGRKWDVVIDNSGYVPRHVRESAEILKENVKTYVFISTISVYKETRRVNMDETAPVGTLEDPKVEKVDGMTYGPLKAYCEAAAEAVMPGRVVTIRPGLIVGPGDDSYRYTYWPVRLDRGGEVLAPGDGTDAVQFIDVRDLAEWCIHMCETPAPGIYNATGFDKVVTMKDLIDTCGGATSSKSTITWVPTAFLEEQKIRPWEDLPVWVPRDGEEGGLNAVSNKKAIAKGLKFRPLVDTAKATLAWVKAQEKEPAETRPRRRPKPGLTAEREAAALAAWREKQGKK
jgi:2'-hydroxyisoflavone reductase